MAVQRTFAFIKPDAVERNLVGRILARFEEEGFRIVALRMVRMTRSQAEKLYSVHVGKPFYKELVDYVTSGPVVLMVLEGEDAVRRVREIIGATNPREAAPGTIRAEYGLDVTRNTIHAADSLENAVREMMIFFTQDDIVG